MQSMWVLALNLEACSEAAKNARAILFALVILTSTSPGLGSP